ncbi:MAG: ATP synthase F1 subunit gamma [bacterium]|nr:ATP synthase F1 subunit gamma [bacterium]
MPNLNDIKNRIRSVKSTGKITQAMKMVAASKVKKAEIAAKESRPYSEYLTKVFAELVDGSVDFSQEQINYENPLANYSALLSKRTVKNAGILVITADKGLAGAYNSNIIKEAQKRVSELKGQGLGAKLFVVGLKGIAALKKAYGNTDVEIIKNYSKIPAIVEVEVANMIAEDMAKAYVDGRIDEIDVIYTEFRSMLSYKVNSFKLLPVSTLTKTTEKVNSEMIFEPSKDAVLQKLLPMYISNSIYKALKEAMASELAARMNAMSNATKNAEEMVATLSVTYNKIRQYGITNEITEVISGANSIKEN